MEDDEDDGDYGGKDKVHSFGGKGQKKSSRKPPAPAPPPPHPPPVEGDERYPTDLPPGAKRPNFDWIEKKKGVMREVMDQGNRRVCWTVSTSREFSGGLVVADKFDPPLCFSPLHLLVSLIDDVDDTGGLSNLEKLREFYINEGAILEEDCNCPQQALAYKKNKSSSKKKKNKSSTELVVCTDQLKAKNVRKFKVKDLTIKEEDEVDEREIMRLLQTGPVTVGIDVNEDFTQFVGDGIFDGGGVTIDEHLFLVYGYGTQMPEGIHFWKVQNSAGLTWGDKGFGKIIRQISREKGKPSLFTRVLNHTLLDHYEGQKENA